MIFRPKYITFDCYGTLTNFRMHEVATEIYASQLPAQRLPLFIKDFAAYRLDEVMGDWKPYDRSSSRRLPAPANATASPSARKTGASSTTPCPPGARTPTCRRR